jgi:hypothetical protein
VAKLLGTKYPPRIDLAKPCWSCTEAFSRLRSLAAKGESNGESVGLQPPYRWKPHGAPRKPLQQFVIVDEEEKKEKREEGEEKEKERELKKKNDGLMHESLYL